MGKAEGAESQPPPAELLCGHTVIAVQPLPCNRDSAGAGAEHSAVLYGWRSSLLLALGLLCHSGLRTAEERP